MTNVQNCPVSVVVPMYKAEPFIARTLDCVTRQKLLPKEVILVDDGSPDQSSKVVEDYMAKKPPFHIELIRQKNGGPGGARNTGIKAAKTENIAFLDQDDLWEPEKIERCWAIFRDLGSDYAALCHGERVETPTGEMLESFYGPYEPDFYKVMLRYGNRLSTSAVLARKSAIEKAGYFDEDRGLFGVEDFDLWLRLATVGKVYFLNELLGTYNIGIGYSNVEARQKRHLSRLLIKHALHPAAPIDAVLTLNLLYRACRLRVKAKLLEKKLLK